MRIVVFCCTRLFGEGVRLLLERELAGCAASVHLCRDPRALFRDRPDLLIVDHTALSSLTPEILTVNGCKALLLGTSCAPLLERQHLANLVSKGLVGIVTSDTDPSTFGRSVVAALSGELWLSSTQVRDLLQTTLAASAGTAIALTPRESEILSLLCEGCRNKEIMARLHISEQAVKSHVSRIGRKFGVTDRLQIVLSALKRWPQLLTEEER